MQTKLLNKAVAWLMTMTMILSMLPATTLAAEAATAVVGEVYFIPGTVESADSIVDAYVIASTTKTPGEMIQLQIPDDIEANAVGGDSLDYATGRFWEYRDAGFTSIRNLTVKIAEGNNAKQKFGYHNAIRSVDTETGLVIMQDGKQHRGSKSASSSYACALGFNEPCGSQNTAKPGNMYGNELGPYVTFVQKATEELPATFILDLRDGVEEKIDTLEELATLASNADNTGGAAGQPVVNAYAADGSYTTSTNYKDIAGHLTAVIIVDTELPPGSDSVLAARRDAAEAYMRRMGTVRWRVESDILYTITSNTRPEDDTNNATRLELKAGRIYQGLPYTYAGGTGTAFLEYATKEENGVYTLEGITWETLSGDGQNSARLGNDCSSSLTRAWASIGADITMTDTKSMAFNNGYLPVGEYVSSKSNNTNSDQICANNGEQTMFAAYAQLQKADGLVYRGASAGHAMMVVSNHPVYKADGTIDGKTSKVTILDQTRTHFRAKEYFYDKELKENVYPIYGIDTEMTYNYMFKSGCLPITCNALIDPAPIVAPVVTDSKANSTFDKDSLLTGTITSNWMIDSLTMTITNATGSVVQEGAVRSARGQNYKIGLGRFLTDKPAGVRGYIDPDALTSGKYHCKLVCRLSSGQEFTVRDFDFTIAGAPTYSISIDKSATYTFVAAFEGYSSLVPADATITNTGTGATGALTVALSGANASSFELNKTSIADIAVSGSDTFTVVPKTGLSAGTYTATVTVSGGNSITASFDVSFTVNAAAPTYSIALSPSGTQTFTAATVGYGAQSAKTITVSNTGTGATGALTVALSGANASSFELNKTSIADIAVSGSDTFTVVPKTGLSAGTYTATVTVNGSNSISASFDVSFTVNPSGGNGGNGGGGGYVPATYSVTVDKADNGSVSVSRKSASKGTSITMTVDPDKGYSLETLSVTDKNGKEISLIIMGNGVYTFKMPASQVTVKATFMEDNAMLNFFVDVPADAYYYDSVLWAAEKNITSGTSATTFSPDATCTRAQAVTFLWKAAGSPAPKSSTMPFADVAADAYYYNAVLWAVEEGITAGTSATTFSPDMGCSRAHIVTFLWNAVGSPTAGGVNPFADATEADYYYNAVLWAAEKSITSGTSATTFSPNDNCLRSQIVTFLYRHFAK